MLLRGLVQTLTICLSHAYAELEEHYITSHPACASLFHANLRYRIGWSYFVPYDIRHGH